MIVQFSDLQKQRDYKQSVVMQFLIGYFKDLQDTSGVDIPYFIKAKNAYNELIHNNKDLNKYYGKIRKRMQSKNSKLFC